MLEFDTSITYNCRDDSVDFGDESTSDHSPDDEERALGGSGEKRSKSRRKLVLFPYKRQLWHEIGFVASFVQLWAASIFWISGQFLVPLLEFSHSCFDRLDGNSRNIDAYQSTIHTARRRYLLDTTSYRWIRLRYCLVSAVDSRLMKL